MTLLLSCIHMLAHDMSAALQIYDTSSVSSKLKLIASGEYTPVPPGTLTAWETHVTLKSHLQGFPLGGQISLRFELLRAQVLSLHGVIFMK